MNRSKRIAFSYGLLGAGVALFLQQFIVALAPAPDVSDAHSRVPIVRTARPIAPRMAENGMALDFTLAANASVDAVVHVKTRALQSMRMNPWLEMFGYDAPASVARGSGSGVIISEDGFIVTNNHVVEGADAIEVSLNNNRSFEATVVGTDPATDLAVLKIQSGTPLPRIPFGDSESLEIGEWVLAVGNPFDLTSTVTAGIVSAKARNINILRQDDRREIFPVESFIQTDAAVNPGNSGGALVDATGKLVGINTAIASKTGSYSGYSFAVPSSIVEKVSADLIAFGRVQRAFLGVRVGEVNERLAEELNLPAVEGVYVSDLTDVGGAEEAGMQPGDVVIELDGLPVRNLPELQERLSAFRPGDEVEVVCIRESQPRRLLVELRDLHGSTRIVDRSEAEWITALGARLAESPNEDGVQVQALQPGNFKDAGITPGFVITHIDGSPVQRPKEVIDLFANGSGGLLVEGVYPNGKKAYYGVAARR